jgi:hypothetical protein
MVRFSHARDPSGWEPMFSDSVEREMQLSDGLLVDTDTERVSKLGGLTPVDASDS